MYNLQNPDVSNMKPEMGTYNFIDPPSPLL